MDYVPDDLDFGLASPIFCAGVTVHKGLKQTEVRLGKWVAIVGIGGLSHMAARYAEAMGMHVVNVDISVSKLKLTSQSPHRGRRERPISAFSLTLFSKG